MKRIEVIEVTKASHKFYMPGLGRGELKCLKFMGN